MTGQQGPSLFGPVPGAIVLGPNENELDFFLLFFPTILSEIMVNQTNLYARQQQQICPDLRWTLVTVK